MLLSIEVVRVGAEKVQSSFVAVEDELAEWGLVGVYLIRDNVRVGCLALLHL